MAYLFLMTFAGSALFAGYLCWEKMLRKSTTQCLRYRTLMIVMLVYVVPWGWIQGIYRFLIRFFFPEQVDVSAEGLINVADIEVKEVAYRTRDYHWLMLGVSIWFAIAVMLLLVRIVKYLMKRHALHALAIKCEDVNLDKTLKHLRQTIRHRRKVEVVWTRVDNETFTLGGIRPVVFLQKEYIEGELYWILKHEVTHVARRDLWVKLLLEFVCCLHWFNPLVYYLNRKIKFLCETSCDERVVKGCTPEECQVYMELLDRNNKGNTLNTPFGSALEGNSNEINARIALIKGRRRINGREKAIAIGIFVFLVFLNSLVAFAYPKIRHVKSEAIIVAEDSVDGGNFWMRQYAEEGYDIPMENILYDEQFVDEAGQIYPTSSSENVICAEHDMVSGIVQVHVKDGNGGCMVETYEGTRCMKCGSVVKGNLLREAEKTFCTHESLYE